MSLSGIRWLWLLLGGAVCLGWVGMRHNVSAQANPTAGPELAISTTLTANAGDTVNVPVVLRSNGSNVAAVGFSLDFDQTCLSFDASDGNGDTLPDAVSFTLPPSFIPSVSYNGGDSDGELDFTIIDYSPPLAALPADSTLVTIRLQVICTPAVGTTRTADLLFASDPPASFGNTQGRDLPGSVSHGRVTIGEAGVTATVTPSATGTLLPTATASATLSATLTVAASPTPTPTAPITLMPTETQPGATATLSPTATATTTPTASPSATEEPLPTFMPVNAAPIARDDTATVTGNPAWSLANQVVIAVLANDQDNEQDTLTVAAIGSPTLGRVQRNANQTLTYTPNPGQRGNDQFTYTIIDASGNQATATVYVQILNLNTRPLPGDDAVTTDEEQLVLIDVLANDRDPDGDPLRLLSATPGHLGQVEVQSDGRIRYTPAADRFGTDSFLYTVSDDKGEEASALVVVTILPVDDAPVGVNDAAMTAADTPVQIDPFANDFDPNQANSTQAPPLNSQLLGVSDPAHGTAQVGDNGQISYQPDPGFQGIDSFVYEFVVPPATPLPAVASAAGAMTPAKTVATTGVATVTVFVGLSAGAVTAAADLANTPEDTPLVLSVLGNDQASSGASLRIMGVVRGHGRVRINADQTLTYQPPLDFYGSDVLTYTVSDGVSGIANAQVTITVNEINDAPLALLDRLITTEDLPTTLAPLANDRDAEGDLLRLRTVSQPVMGRLEALGNEWLTFSPQTNATGADRFTYRLTDSKGGDTLGLVLLQINDLNDNPVVADDVALAAEDLPVVIDVLRNDIELDPGDTFSVQLIGQAEHGRAVRTTDGKIRYTPALDFVGSDSFGYAVADRRGGVAVGQVEVHITPINDAPHLQTPGPQRSHTGDSVALQLLASDVDSNLLLYSASPLPPGLQIDRRRGLIHGVVALGSAGDYPVQVTVADGSLSHEVHFGWQVVAGPVLLSHRQYLPIVVR